MQIMCIVRFCCALCRRGRKMGIIVYITQNILFYYKNKIRSVLRALKPDFALKNQFWSLTVNLKMYLKNGNTTKCQPVVCCGNSVLGNMAIYICVLKETVLYYRILCKDEFSLGAITELLSAVPLTWYGVQSATVLLVAQECHRLCANPLKEWWQFIYIYLVVLFKSNQIYCNSLQYIQIKSMQITCNNAETIYEEHCIML